MSNTREATEFWYLAMKRDRFRCFLCNGTDDMSIHNRAPKRTITADDLSDLMTVCGQCRETILSKVILYDAALDK